MTTSQSEIENKKVTLYLIVEDTKETNKKIKENALHLINDQSVNENVCSLPLFSSFRGSLVDAAEKVCWEKRNWLRLVLKAQLKEIEYPAYQFEKSSGVPFYLMDAYEEAFEEAAENATNPPKFIENGKERGSILKIYYLDGETKRFSFLYQDKNSDSKFLSPVYSLNEYGEMFTSVVDWFLNENQSFRTHYNKILKRSVERKPSEIVDTTNSNIVTVINPATTSIVCTDQKVWPVLTHVTKINNEMLPRRSEYKFFLKQDMTSPKAFNELKTAQGRLQVGWKYTIQGGIKNAPVRKKKKEKVKLNLRKARVSLWRRLLEKARRDRQK